MTPEEALSIAAKIIGSKAEIAKHLGVSRQLVDSWKQCPPKYVLKVEALVKEAARETQKRLKRGVTRSDLCPEFYPPTGKA